MTIDGSTARRLGRYQLGFLAEYFYCVDEAFVWEDAQAAPRSGGAHCAYIWSEPCEHGRSRSRLLDYCRGKRVIESMRRISKETSLDSRHEVFDRKYPSQSDARSEEHSRRLMLFMKGIHRAVSEMLRKSSEVKQSEAETSQVRLHRQNTLSPIRQIPERPTIL